MFIHACHHGDVAKLGVVMDLPGFELEKVLSRGLAEALLKDQVHVILYILLGI